MCRCSSETTAFGFPALIFRLNRNQSETEEQCLNTNPEDRIQFLYQKILLLHLLPKMERSVSFSVPEPCGGMLIGLSRPPDFLGDQYQDEVFILLGLQVMCPVPWMDLSWVNDCLHDLWAIISKANRQNCEVLVLNMAG